VRELTSTLSSDEVCRLLLGKAIDHVGARRASVMLVGPSRQLRIACAVGVPDAVVSSVRIPLGQGIAGTVAETHRSMWAVESPVPRGASTGIDQEYATDSFLSVPIGYQGNLRGVLNVADRYDDACFGADDLQLLEELAGHGAVALQNAERYEALLARSQHDGLTGLANRSHCWSVLRTELARAKRYGRVLSVVMLDVDYFKQYNDSFGHLEGDRALEQVASVIRGSCRSSDIASRYGGEEFVVVLPETSIDGAVRLAEKIRAGVQADDLRRLRTPLSVSAGVASYPAHGRNIRSIVEAADRQLYRAKRRGRNRVCFPSDGDVG